MFTISWFWQQNKEREHTDGHAQATTATPLNINYS